MFWVYKNDKVIIITMKIFCKILIDRKANVTPFCRAPLSLPAWAAGRVKLCESSKSFIPWVYSGVCKRHWSWITLLPSTLSHTSSALPSATHCLLQAFQAGVSFLFHSCSVHIKQAPGLPLLPQGMLLANKCILNVAETSDKWCLGPLKFWET